jgi:hypothetical protein
VRNNLVFFLEEAANADGSVDLYIQNETPGVDKDSNWLPASKRKVVLMLRMYWPHKKSPSIINGTWAPPAVKKIDGKNVSYQTTLVI